MVHPGAAGGEAALEQVFAVEAGGVCVQAAEPFAALPGARPALGNIRDGDVIAIDVEARRLDVRLSDEELTRDIHEYQVYARVSPADKLRVVTAWQAHDANLSKVADFMAPRNVPLGDADFVFGNLQSLGDDFFLYLGAEYAHAPQAGHKAARVSGNDPVFFRREDPVTDRRIAQSDVVPGR